MRYLLSIIFFCFSSVIFAQIGINTTNPQATLDVTADGTATADGILIPRVTSLSGSVGSGRDGMIVFLTTNWTNAGSTFLRGFYFWENGIGWREFTTTSRRNSFTIGDIKTGIQTTDHNGWYLLDGRAVTTLNANAQNAASSLSLGTNLPNATNRFLKQDASLGTLGGNAGSTVTLTQANLPNVSFSGTAAVAGVHVHTASSNASGIHSHTGASSSNGNHSHGGSTSNGGSHTHNFRSASNGSGADNQGFPVSNNHRAIRTTNINNFTVGSTSGGPILTSGNHAHGLSISNAGNHNHSLNINSAGNHNHSISMVAAGSHGHTVSVSSGGSNTPIDITPGFIGVNMFIYLGE